ncbi:SDR family oxidoreductase [Aquiflexum sp.]|uniref:SDR family oxidoreductase n=1 Tax=Aquiflexum sp. TaxID=1872584 RepID=UPI0035944AB2
MNILIVGATGQLGFTICQKLIDSGTGHSVFATHRKSSNTSALKELSGIQIRLLDLTDSKTFASAIQGIDAVIITANTATPSQKSDSFKDVDEKGVIGLIETAKASNVKQIIYVSALPFEKGDDKVPLSQAKRAVEKHLEKSGLNYTVIQPTAFMEVYFPFFGSTVPLKGLKVSTVKRPFKFSNNFFAGIKNDIEQKNRFNVIGKGDKKNAYISIENVADFCIAAIDNSKASKKTIQIGGPEPMTPLEVKAIFEELYGKQLKVKATPPFVIKLMSKILPISNKAAGNIMAMNYAISISDSVPPNIQKTASEFGVNLINPKEFLSHKFHAHA